MAATTNKTVDYSKAGGEYDYNDCDPFWAWRTKDYELDRGEDKPAVIYNSGRQEWWRRGKQHREGNPALTLKDGSYVYYFRGKIHNLKGPASYDASSGRTAYYIMGKRYRTPEEFACARTSFLEMKAESESEKKIE